MRRVLQLASSAWLIGVFGVCGVIGAVSPVSSADDGSDLLLQSAPAAAASGRGGSVYFANRVAGAVDAPIFDIDGKTKLEGDDYLVQLYGGPKADGLEPWGAAVGFRKGVGAGYFVPAERNIGSVPAGEQAYVQLRVWESGLGLSYESAVEAGSKYGLSTVLGLRTGGSGRPPSVPSNLVGLKSFGLVVETNLIRVSPGFTLLSNPLSRGKNTVVEVLPSVPNGTILYRYDNVRQVYSMNIYDFGQWLLPDETWLPGEGAFLFTAGDEPVDVMFLGRSTSIRKMAVRQAGFYLMGGQAPIARHVEEFLAFEPKEGDTVYHFSEGRYLLTIYEFGEWQGIPPVVAPGGAMFVRLMP